MMRRIVALALILGVLIVPNVAEAQSTAGAQSLLITPGARADGMGRAYIALADDPTSVWWNVGGLAFTKERTATLMHTKLVPGLADDVYYEYLGFSQPMEDVGGVGANIIYLTYGKSVAVDEYGNEGEKFGSYEVAATGAIGFKLNEKIGFGAALKVVYVMLAPAWATPEKKKGAGSSFAVDFGFLYREHGVIPWLGGTDQLNVAVVLTNVGPDIAFIDEGQSSPLGHILKLGIMYEPYRGETTAFRVTYDLNQPMIISEDIGFFDRLVDIKKPLFGSREQPIQNLGGEFAYTQGNILAAARFGYVYDPEGTIEDWTFGIGVGLGQFGIDWAMVPQARSLEENVHKFSINVKF